MYQLLPVRLQASAVCLARAGHVPEVTEDREISGVRAHRGPSPLPWGSGFRGAQVPQRQRPAGEQRDGQVSRPEGGRDRAHESCHRFDRLSAVLARSAGRRKGHGNGRRRGARCSHRTGSRWRGPHATFFHPRGANLAAPHDRDVRALRQGSGSRLGCDVRGDFGCLLLRRLRSLADSREPGKGGFEPPPTQPAPALRAGRRPLRGTDDVDAARGLAAATPDRQGSPVSGGGDSADP